MPKAKSYVSRVNDAVFARGYMGRLVVVSVDSEKEIADLVTVGDDVLTPGVPWKLLAYSDAE